MYIHVNASVYNRTYSVYFSTLTQGYYELDIHTAYGGNKPTPLCISSLAHYKYTLHSCRKRNSQPFQTVSFYKFIVDCTVYEYPEHLTYSCYLQYQPSLASYPPAAMLTDIKKVY